MVAIADLKESVMTHLSRGDVSVEVIQGFRKGDGTFVQRESELWDYKEQLGTTKLDQAELVRDVLAFYNSYGGYLIFGVSDVGELCGCDEQLDEHAVRSWTRTYGHVDIQLAISHHTLDGRKVSLIYIPKRERSEVPAAIAKQGPDLVTRRGSLFKPGDIFFRAGDSSQLLRGSEDLRFLMGERRHSADASGRALTIRLTHNNLPDRSIIYDKFFGRKEVKEELWAWLADQMSRYRVLAGPGGVGKTSAAYSFCEEVCTGSPLGLDQVVWLSAKREQFSASRNATIPLPYKEEARTFGEAYSSYDTLLDALSYHLAISDDEWEGIDRNLKVRRLAESLAIVPSLVVIDDLDSLTPDDQRLAVEFAMAAGSAKSRFLFTTRKNYLAPLSSTTELSGLEGDEFKNYVTYLQDIYGRTLTPSELRSFERDTEGSPLFAESIFRLLKLGEKFNDALSRWKGADGEAVRAASFRRELEQLSWASKKVLFAMSMFESVSLVEVRKMTELESSEVEPAIAELDRLFLIQSKEIGKESRFEVAPNLKRLLQDLKADLVPNHTEITRRASTLRSDSKAGQSRGKSKVIAAAIRQAMAQLGEGEPLAAKTTVESVLDGHGSSADLWMVYARCLTAISPLDITKVRQAFQKSFALGKREPQLFIKWIEFELQYGHSNAAVDVGERGAADLRGTANSSEWKLKRAEAHFKRGKERVDRREYTDAMKDLHQAAKLVASAARHASLTSKHATQRLAQSINDTTWAIVTLPGQFTIIDRYDAARLALETGDDRPDCIARLLDAVEFAMREPRFRIRNELKLSEWIGEVSKQVRSNRLPMLLDRFQALENSFRN